jgi:N-acyl-D-aspartate/D-glutamate deacylase
MLGSCSLSTIHVDGTEAGDLFGRVEAIPREHVITAVDQHKTWRTCDEYVQALEELPLGPNLAAFIGHSDMRTAVMGLDRATRKDERPTRGEQAEMERMLTEALEAGFVGMSSMQLLFDKLDGDTCRSRTLPSTYAKPRELRRLKSLLRKAGRVLQSAPDIGNPLNLVSQVAQSLGIVRNPLKTSLLSAADVKSNPYAVLLMGPVSRLVNRFGADFRWQHLPVPFEVYADGIDLVIFEEFGSGAAALHLRNEVERNEMMRDEEYRRRFRKDYESRFGVRVWHRDFFDADIVDCPDAEVIGKSFGRVGDERGLHPVDAFLDLVERAVHRLTGELADWYRLDAGHLRVGDRADVVILDPRRLDDRLDAYAEEQVAQCGGLSRMVNRNDETVDAVFVGGRAVFMGGSATELVGRQRTGRFLRAAHESPALPTEKG